MIFCNQLQCCYVASLCYVNPDKIVDSLVLQTNMQLTCHRNQMIFKFTIQNTITDEQNHQRF
jgi:hypothetical protein